MSEVQPSAIQSWVGPQIYSVMTKMIHMGRNELDEKNKRAVFIGIPHEATEKDTKEEDEKMLREAITACNNQQLSESYANGHITTKRHPNYRAGPKGYRPLKVMFESQIHHDIFLRSLRRNGPSKMQSLPHSYVRRDYTADELKYDRILRRTAGQENQKLGVTRFVVRDLQIIQLKNDRPLSRPFPTRSISPDSITDNQPSISTNNKTPSNAVNKPTSRNVTVRKKGEVKSCSKKSDLQHPTSKKENGEAVATIIGMFINARSLTQLLAPHMNK
ncbi:hypothetical protein Tcan_14089 [Toxocara canis]|uniref:Uncharacterized protein n=1 Tax=Toxocara canis TaxID=6265 RepID=A0A0B2V0I5_TOXCA|nr:hypothetical protein Tcan_14089 [Toxocara canis]